MRLVYVRFTRPRFGSIRIYVHIPYMCLRPHVDASVSFFLLLPSFLPSSFPLFFNLPPPPLSLSFSFNRCAPLLAFCFIHPVLSCSVYIHLRYVALSRLMRFQSFATIFAGCLVKEARETDSIQERQTGHEPFASSIDIR